LRATERVLNGCYGSEQTVLAANRIARAASANHLTGMI